MDPTAAGLLGATLGGAASEIVKPGVAWFVEKIRGHAPAARDRAIANVQGLVDYLARRVTELENAQRLAEERLADPRVVVMVQQALDAASVTADALNQRALGTIIAGVLDSGTGEVAALVSERAVSVVRSLQAIHLRWLAVLYMSGSEPSPSVSGEGGSDVIELARLLRHVLPERRASTQDVRYLCDAVACVRVNASVEREWTPTFGNSRRY